MIRLLLAACTLAALAGCSKKSVTAPAALPPRTFMMGFSGDPPRADINILIQSIQLWSKRADAALILHEPPWDSLLAGRNPDSLITRDDLPLANFYRGLGLKLVVSIDPGNGLDRSNDSSQLQAAGRSMQEPAIRAMYRTYVEASNRILNPDYLGVASETNLIRGFSPAPLYNAIVLAADSAAADVRVNDATVILFTTVQVDMAWGRITPPFTYLGIDQDRTDFAFDQVLGLSSYPYLAGFADPDSIPTNYYSKLVEGAPIPMMVIEGGWNSVTYGATPTSPDKQRRYINRQMTLLDQANAIGVFQITFTDLDLTAVPPPFNTSLIPFATLGLVDENLVAKPALSAWDAAFKRPRP